MSLLLISGASTYNVTAALFTLSASIFQSAPVKRHKFTYCFQDHPCSHLPPNCTAGHILDVQYGGASHCYNCVPQDLEQQRVHSIYLSQCFYPDAASSIIDHVYQYYRGPPVMHFSVTPSEKPCGYSFDYQCSASVISKLSSFLLIACLFGRWRFLSFMSAVGALHVSGKYAEIQHASGLIPIGVRSSGVAHPYVNLRPDCSFLLTTSSLWPTQCEIPLECGPELHIQRLQGVGLASEQDLCYRVPHVRDVYSVYEWAGDIPSVFIPGVGRFSVKSQLMPTLGLHHDPEHCGVYYPGAEKHALHYNLETREYYYHEDLFNIPAQCHYENTTAAFREFPCDGLVSILPSGALIPNYDKRRLYLDQVSLSIEPQPLPTTLLGPVDMYTNISERLFVDGPVTVRGVRYKGVFAFSYHEHFAYFGVAFFLVSGVSPTLVGDSLFRRPRLRLQFLVNRTQEAYLGLSFVSHEPHQVQLYFNSTQSGIKFSRGVLASRDGDLLIHSLNFVNISMDNSKSPPRLNVFINNELAFYSVAPGKAIAGASAHTGMGQHARWWFLSGRTTVNVSHLQLNVTNATVHWMKLDILRRNLTIPALTFNETCVRTISIISDVGLFRGLLNSFIYKFERMVVRLFTHIVETLWNLVVEVLDNLIHTTVGFKLFEISFISLCVHLQYLNLPLTAVSAAIAAIIFHL